MFDQLTSVDIKKLKYPLWYNIVFVILTIVIPLSLFVYECLKDPYHLKYFHKI